MTARGLTLAGSLAGGFLASVCCIVPLAFAALGLSGAAFAIRLEPARPYFLVLTFGLLGYAFYVTHRPAIAPASDAECCEPGPARSGRLAFWIAAVFVVLITAFPTYAPYLF